MNQVELRPAHLDDWLDTLPYTETDHCLRALATGLRRTAEAAVKPAQRVELMTLYWPRYLYLLNSRIRSTGLGATQIPAQRYSQIAMLRQITTSIADGSRIGAHEMLSQRSLFGSPKRSGRAMLLAATAYAHSLILGYQEYLGATPDLWKAMHQLVDDATLLKLVDELYEDPDGAGDTNTTIARVYAAVSACAVADPHKLEANDVWQVYELARRATEPPVVKPFDPAARPNSSFVIDMRRASAPMSYSKVSVSQVTKFLRTLDCSALARQCQRQLAQAQARGAQQKLMRDSLSPRLLDYLVQAWSATPVRRYARQSASGRILLVAGLLNTHAELSSAHGTDVAAENSWDLINENPGGRMVCTRSVPKDRIRVGDVVILRGDSENRWTVGVVAWLLEDAGGTVKAGIQHLARAARAVRLRALDGPEILTTPRPGLILGPLSPGGDHTILTSPGLFRPEQILEIIAGDAAQTITAGTALKSTMAFDQFNYRA
ncbi:MAG: hypothetical protein H6978_03360 [Gammaproteobacteria bacterium]|nr:hypothetical protein [Gammaproteobacteria bacterium]